jgi:hypothetical protein
MQTIAQAYRQSFGYFMEEIVAEYFRGIGEIVLSYKNHHVNINAKGYHKDYEVPMVKLYDRCSRALMPKHHTTNIQKISTMENLVACNAIEILRFEKHKPIISEVKSQYVTYNSRSMAYRIEITTSEIECLSTYNRLGISSSVIYCVALPCAHFIEIPFNKIKNRINKRNRLIIPKEYRNMEKYTVIPDCGYNNFDGMT